MSGWAGRGIAFPFIRAFVRSPVELGTCFTSSRWMARALADGMGIGPDWGDRAPPPTVIELGPGTGPVTAEILRRLPAGSRFLAVERNPDLAAAFRDRFPRVALHEGDATEIRRIAPRYGVAPGVADAVVCAIPLLLVPDEARAKILRGAAAMLRPGGRFCALTYGSERLLRKARSLRRDLEGVFHHVEPARLVWRNIPPAFVYRCEREP